MPVPSGGVARDPEGFRGPARRVTGEDSGGLSGGEAEGVGRK